MLGLCMFVCLCVLFSFFGVYLCEAKANCERDGSNGDVGRVEWGVWFVVWFVCLCLRLFVFLVCVCCASLRFPSPRSFSLYVPSYFLKCTHDVSILLTFC